MSKDKIVISAESESRARELALSLSLWLSEKYTSIDIKGPKHNGNYYKVYMDLNKT